MHRNTSHERLIGDKRLQLGEAPRVECCALRPTSLDPRANVGQIFDRNRSLRAFGLRNNPFGDYMVDVFGESSFLAGQHTQPPTTVLRAQSLKLIPEPTMPIAYVLDRAPAVDGTIAINRNVGHTQIDTQHIVNINRIGSFNLGSREQIPVTTHEGKIAFTATEGQQRTLARTTDERDRLPAIESPDRNRRALVCQNAFIKRDRAKWSKGATRLLIQLVGIRHFGDTTDGELGSNAKGFARRAIGQPMDGELPKRSGVPCDLANIVAGRVGGFKRALQRIRLLGCGQEFQLDRQSHNMSIAHANVCVNGYQSNADAVRSAVRNAPLRYRLFPRAPKGGGSLRGF